MIFTLVYDYPELKETTFIDIHIDLERYDSTSASASESPQRFSEAEVLSLFKNNYDDLMLKSLVCIITYNSLTGDTKQVWNKYGGWKK